MSIEKKEECINKLCVNCNKFYGSETQAGLCSTCFRQTNNKVIHPQISKTQTICVKTSCPQQNPPLPQVAVKQIDTSRCFKCSKKVGLLGINCKCTLTFCNLHRLPESHSCPVDYRQLGKQKLTKEIQKVAPSKITQI